MEVWHSLLGQRVTTRGILIILFLPQKKNRVNDDFEWVSSFTLNSVNRADEIEWNFFFSMFKIIRFLKNTGPEGLDVFYLRSTQFGFV